MNTFVKNHCLKVQQCKLIREARRDNHMDAHKEI